MERRLTDLGELKWELVRVDKSSGKPVGNPIPGRVPGDVISDLLENGMIDDPYKGLNSRKITWVNDYDWLYRARFKGKTPPGERRFLRFDGVDYEAWFSINGRALGSHEGQFGRVVYEITSHLDNENEIEVLLVGRKDKPQEKIKFGNPIMITERVRGRHLKAHYSYGWDFAPAMKNAGIWDDAFMHDSGPVTIDDVWIQPDVNGMVVFELSVNSKVAGDGMVKWRIEPVGHDGAPIDGSREAEIVSGAQRFRLETRIEKPAIWNPWEMGSRPMYKLSAEIAYQGENSDAISDKFAFRSIGWEASQGAPPGSAPWTLVVNGKRLFMRGVNWVPMDSMARRLTPERYRTQLEMIRDMGANMIRIWGGGLREKKIFYEICDELGLLVWQEFPLSCCFFVKLPRGGAFKKLVSSEVGEIVRQLRNRPSVFMWCGGNEVQIGRNREIFEIMQRQTSSLDGTRRFHPISPSRGDAHNWVVWHGKGNPDDYMEEENPLISEFGLQAVPNRETLEKMFEPEQLWPPDKKAWRHHNIDFGKMNKYAKNIPGDGGLDAYIDASQRMQAYTLKTAVERWRRMKFKKTGVGIWQFNEPWPAICWSLVDYFGRPKKSYYALKNSMAPVMVALFYPHREWRDGMTVPFDIAVVNDLHEELGELIATVFLGDREIEKQRIKVRGNSVSSIESRRAQLSAPPWILKVSLTDTEGREIARNEYDLEVFDPKRANPLIAEIFRATWHWMTKEQHL